MNIELTENGTLKINGKAVEGGDEREFGRDFSIPNSTTKRGLEADSTDYHVLENAAAGIKEIPGMICEIGTRRGGSLAFIVRGLMKSQDHNRNVVCIDPYGNIDYPIGDREERQSLKLDYTNKMRNESLVAIYSELKDIPINVVCMCLEDTEFFKRYSDGVPFYQENKVVEDQYALVFFDGPHTDEALTTEIEFFATKTPKGGMWVFDDLELYNHDNIEKLIESKQFTLVDKTKRKASYIKSV